MDKIVDDLKVIKESISNTYFDQVNNAENTAFNKLIFLRNLDEDLKETLILLHSTYITELEVIKKFNYKALDQILDNNLEAYRIIADKDDQLSKVFENLEKKQPSLSMSRVIMFVVFMVCITGFLGAIWYMFSVDKQAGVMLIDVIKAILDKVEPVNLNQVVAPSTGN